jgi:hypothetical protein
MSLRVTTARALADRPSASRVPLRVRITPLLNLALLALLLCTFATGWAATLLGLSEFAPHRLSSIAFIVVIGAHIALHGRSLIAQVKRWLCLNRRHLGHFR